MIYGFGVNDADYTVQPYVNGKRTPCKFYVTWVNMLQRACCEKFKSKHPTYSKCKVVDEWKSFMTFRKWMESQDWVDKDLDKDILSDSLEYGPDTCVFVDRATNNFFCNYMSCQGVHSKGVTYDMRNRKFLAQVSVGKAKRWVSTHETELEAKKAYQDRIRKYAIELANRQSDIRVKSAILNKLNMSEVK